MFYIRQFCLYSTLLLWTASASALNATELSGACDEARALQPHDVARSAGGDFQESHCYRLDLTSAGLLHLDVAVAPGSHGVRLDMWQGGETPPPETLGRATAERLIMADAGTHFIVVTGEDPRRPLPGYRLGSRFVEVGKSETDGEIEVEPEGFRPVGFAFKSETDGEIEVEPEGLRGGCSGTGKSETDGEIEVEPEGFRPVGFAFKSETDGEIEVEPEGSRIGGCGFLFKSETDGEIEVEPEGRVREGSRIGCAPTPKELLCQASEGDDHGDSLACATPFASRAAGELANGWGDDVDVFRFELCDWQTVEIVTGGGTDTHGVLLDRTGQRLAGDDDGGEGENFRLVRTLGPGSYFVRVAAATSTGMYTLAMQRLDR